MHSNDMMKNEDPYNQPDLLDVVKHGIAKLTVRNLRFPPLPEDIPIFCEVLTEDLVRANKVNVEKINNALNWIGGNDTDFPQPARVLQVLKSQEPPRQTYKELPLPDVTPLVAEANLKKIREMLAGFGTTRKAKPKPKKYMESKYGSIDLTDQQLITLQKTYAEMVLGDKKIEAGQWQKDYTKQCLAENAERNK